jgi:hypothetical protein
MDNFIPQTKHIINLPWEPPGINREQLQRVLELAHIVFLRCRL